MGHSQKVLEDCCLGHDHCKFLIVKQCLCQGKFLPKASRISTKSELRDKNDLRVAQIDQVCFFLFTKG